jgi:hypothetical protein
VRDLEASNNNITILAAAHLNETLSFDGQGPVFKEYALSLYSQLNYLQSNSGTLKSILPQIPTLKTSNNFDLVIIGEHPFEYEFAYLMHLPYL